MSTDNISQVTALFESWDLPKKSREEQVEWIKQNVVAEVARLFPQLIAVGDIVEDIITVPDLKDAMVEALTNATVHDEIYKSWPENFASQETRDLFTRMCQRISITELPVERFGERGIVSPNPDQQFIHIITREQKARDYILRWDQKNGITASLIEQGCPVLPSYEELRMIFLFLYSADRLANMSRKIQRATATPDLDF